MHTNIRVAAVLAVVVAVCGALLSVVFLGRSERKAPVRCGAELVMLGARCCAQGQALVDGGCRGIPAMCPDGWRAVSEPIDACVVRPGRVRVPAATVQLVPSDWEAQGVVRARTFRVRPFDIDAAEVTHDRWLECASRRACPALSPREPGLPVTDVSPEQAMAFCRASGGRLPSGDEWLSAAIGGSGRRFPWGQTGLVCRRASFGLVRGPCGHGATGPDLAGARPEGATPLGVQDLAGNVAEWTAEPGGRFVARGGSYRSEQAAELKSWALEVPAGPAAHVGFRCVYEVSEE